LTKARAKASPANKEPSKMFGRFFRADCKTGYSNSG
jgi:hypothetical protein